MDAYDRIDAILSEKKISRRKFAQLIGVAPSTFQSMMARKRGLSFEILMRIVSELQISAVEFWDSVQEPDREYELVCETLAAANLSIESAGFGEGPDEDGDHFYVWHTDAEEPEEDKVEFVFRDLLRIVSAVQKDADLRKQDYIRKRLEAELF